MNVLELLEKAQRRRLALKVYCMRGRSVHLKVIGSLESLLRWGDYQEMVLDLYYPGCPRLVQAWAVQGAGSDALPYTENHKSPGLSTRAEGETMADKQDLLDVNKMAEAPIQDLVIAIDGNRIIDHDASAIMEVDEMLQKFVYSPGNRIIDEDASAIMEADEMLQKFVYSPGNRMIDHDASAIMEADEMLQKLVYSPGNRIIDHDASAIMEADEMLQKLVYSPGNRIIDHDASAIMEADEMLQKFVYSPGNRIIDEDASAIMEAEEFHRQDGALRDAKGSRHRAARQGRTDGVGEGLNKGLNHRDADPCKARQDGLPSTTVKRKHPHRKAGAHFSWRSVAMVCMGASCLATTGIVLYAAVTAVAEKTPEMQLQDWIANLVLLYDVKGLSPQLYDVKRLSPQLYNVKGKSPQLYDVRRLSPQLYDVKRLSPQLYNVKGLSLQLYNVKRLSPQLYDVKGLSPQLYDLYNMKRLSPQLYNMKGQSPQLYNVKRLSPQLYNVKRLSPQLYNVKWLSPQLYNVKRLSPQLYDVKGLSPQLYDVKRLSPQLYNVKGQSPQLYDVRRLSPQLYDVKRLSPQLYNVKGLSLQLYNVKRLSPQLYDVKGLSPQLYDVKGLSPQLYDVKRLSPQLCNVKRLSPQLYDVKGLSPQLYDLYNVKWLSPQLYNVKRLSPQLYDVKGLSPQLYDVKRLSPQLYNVKGQSPQLYDLYNVKRLSPQLYDVKGLSPQLYDVKGLSPQLYDVKRLSPQLCNVKRLSPQLLWGVKGLSPQLYDLYNMKGLSPQLCNVKRLSPQLCNVKRLSPQLYNVKRLSPQLYNVKRLSPQLYNMKGLSPQLCNVKRLSPQLYNVKRLSTQLYNVKRLSPQLNNMKGLSPELCNVKRLSPQLYNVKRLSTQLYNVKGLSPQLYNVKVFLLSQEQNFPAVETFYDDFSTHTRKRRRRCSRVQLRLQRRSSTSRHELGSPPSQKLAVRRKITGLFDEWKILSKSKNNSGVTPAEKQKTFQESLPDLLDIAHSEGPHSDDLSPEDKEFLLAQREKGRRGSMAGLDKKLKESVCRRESFLSRSRQQTPKGEEMVELESSSSESSSPANAANTSTSSSDAGVASPPKRLRTRGTNSVLSPDLVGALNRTGVSSRQALRIVAATASSLGHDPQELVLNPESIRQARAKYRSTLAKDIKETFSPLTPLTVHWDGKILPQDDGTRAERLAILVTGEGVEKLLGVPKLHSGTGDAAATAVFEALEDQSRNESWRCASTQLVPTLEPSMITIFSRFKDYWSYINQSAINPHTNEDLPETLASKRDDLIQGLKRLLQTKQPRDDYKELAELSILFPRRRSSEDLDP
ncbi:Avirulence protein AvrBs3 [Chionoecetes opilio]|uniref:Avirulence protein AvrBs3 n=1 Tax=Chionoecetes opilio TaxID=41210 RepID=A0A8J4YI44_CHIOP|nr:Avirulence protein AvrBs3 [Chionoecetes opilio]